MTLRKLSYFEHYGGSRLRLAHGCGTWVGAEHFQVEKLFSWDEEERVVLHS